MKIKRKYFRTDLIDSYLLDYNLTKKQFCEKCKISYVTLHKMYKSRCKRFYNFKFQSVKGNGN